MEKIYDQNDDIVNNSNNIIEHSNFKIITPIIFFFLIASIVVIIIYFNKSKKSNQEKIISAQITINKNKETIESKDKIINDITKKLKDLTPNENFEEAFNRFQESNIYTKIKHSLEGITLLTKNTQAYSKITLSEQKIILLTKTFNECFPNAIRSIKQDYAGITNSDIKFLILGFMNLNDVEIAVLLGLTYSAANKRNNKIKNIFNIKSDLHDFLFKYIKSKF